MRKTRSTSVRLVTSALRRTKKLKYALVSVAAVPFIALATAAQAHTTPDMVSGLGGNSMSGTSSMFFNDYFDLSQATSAFRPFSNLMYNDVARDIMIAILMAICIAMVTGASFLWRENAIHLRSDVEKEKRRRLNDL